MGRFYTVSVDKDTFQEAVKGVGQYGRFEQGIILNELRPNFVQGLLRTPGFSAVGLFNSRDEAINELERRYAEKEGNV